MIRAFHFHRLGALMEHIRFEIFVRQAYTSGLLSGEQDQNFPVPSKVVLGQRQSVHFHYERASSDASTISDEERDGLRILLRPFVEECERAYLKLSKATARDMLGLLDQKAPSRSLLRGMASDLASRTADELRETVCFVVDPKNEKYIREIHGFGTEVADAFPSTIRDIEEAGRCLAFYRSTAVVFHLIRVMEIGLRCLSNALGIPYAPSWEAHLKQIKTKMEMDYKDKPPEWKKDEPFFRDVMGDLISVKLVWRNPTMHVKRHYEYEEAEQIFAAVRTFMQRLATKLHEPTEPDASEALPSESPTSGLG